MESILYIVGILLIWYFTLYRLRRVTDVFDTVMNAYISYLNSLKDEKDTEFIKPSRCSWWGWLCGVFSIKVIDYHLFLTEEELQTLRPYITNH